MRKLVLLAQLALIGVFILEFCYTFLKGGSIFHFIHYAMGFHITLLLFSLTFTVEGESKLQSVFSWKMWVLPLALMIAFSLFSWQLNPVRNYWTNLLGYNWQWSALALWATLFFCQLFLYQHKGLSNIHAFSLSLSFVFLATILYELPWNFAVKRWQFLWHPKFMVSALTAIIFLKAYRWQFAKVDILAFIPVIFSFIFFFSMPYGGSWIPRLSVFPIVLAQPFNLRSHHVS